MEGILSGMEVSKVSVFLQGGEWGRVVELACQRLYLKLHPYREMALGSFGAFYPFRHAPGVACIEE